MKIILTGSTGMIGSEVLTYTLAQISITSIIILSRRPLSPSQLPLPSKAKVLLLSSAEFTSYPPSVMREIEGAEACIWVLGGLPHLYPSLAIAREVNIDYPVYAAGVFAKTLAPALLSKAKKFTFWYVSGKAVERDLEKPLWVLRDARKIKGEIENKLITIQDERKDSFQLHLARVGSVIPKNNLAMKVLGIVTGPFYPAIGVEGLAAGMVGAVVDGGEGLEVLVEHAVLRRLGEGALRV